MGAADRVPGWGVLPVVRNPMAFSRRANMVHLPTYFSVRRRRIIFYQMTWLETQQLRVGVLTCLNHHLVFRYLMEGWFREKGLPW